MNAIKEALKKIGTVYQFSAPPKSPLPYMVFAPDGANDFTANGIHIEKATEGTIDLYTGDADEPMRGQIEAALDALAGSETIAWYLNSVQYETEAGTPESGYTGLIHYEWVFQIGGR